MSKLILSKFCFQALWITAQNNLASPHSHYFRKQTLPTYSMLDVEAKNKIKN